MGMMMCGDIGSIVHLKNGMNEVEDFVIRGVPFTCPPLSSAYGLTHTYVPEDTSITNYDDTTVSSSDRLILISTTYYTWW